MTEIKIILAGEGWKNSLEVVNKLYSLPPTEPVIIITIFKKQFLKTTWQA